MQNAFGQGLHGISLDYTYVPEIDFAYDNCLLEDNAEDAQHLLDSVVHAAKNFGLKINASKTKFCPLRLQINNTCSGKQLKTVEKFTYLGPSIQPNGDIKGEIKVRCAKSLGALKKVVKFWSGGFQRRSNQKFATLRSGALHCFAVKRGHSKHMILKNCFEIRCARSILSPSRVALSSLLTSVEFLNSVAASPRPSRSAD